jgi:arsenate reductase-like glutaredoxin family protein
LGTHKISISEQVDAKKASIAAAGLEAAFGGVEEILATKGKKVISLKISPGGIASEEAQALLIGPSGNLRAPAIRAGSKLIVGFDEAMFEKHVLGE